MSNKGFTLIEIVIAFTISVLILLLVFSGFRLSTRSYEKITETEELSQRQRALNERLGWLIKGIYPYRIIDKKEGKERLFFIGRPESLGFVTTSVIPDTGKIYDVAGLKWVYLFVDSEGLKEKDGIYFLEENLETPDKDAVIIDPAIESMSVEYFDPEGNEWVEEWTQDRENLPSAIKIRLKLLHNNNTIQTPDMVFSLRAADN